MSRLPITTRVQNLLALGATEAEIEATGVLNEHGEWCAHNYRELSAFEVLEARTQLPYPWGTFERITLSNGESVMGARLPLGVEAFTQAVIIRVDGGRNVVVIGEKHHDTADGAVHYLASSKTETDIAPA